MTENEDNIEAILRAAEGTPQPGEIPGGESGNNNNGEQQQQHQEQKPENLTPQPKEIFGEGVEDWERAKAVWAETNTRASEVEDLRRVKTELEAKLADSSTDFADDDVMSYNNFVKSTGQKDYDLFQRLLKHDTSTNPLDTLVLKEVMDNPELKGHEELIKKRLMKTFEVDPDAFSEDEVKLGQINIQQAAKAAGQKIESIKAELAKKPAPTQKPNPEQFVKEWTSAITEELQDLNSIDIPVRRGDKLEKLTDFALTPELKAKYQEHLAGVFAQAGSVTPEVRQRVKQVFNAKFISDNLPDIIHAVEQKITTGLEEKYDREYNGVKFDKQPGGEAPSENGENYSNLFEPITNH